MADAPVSSLYSEKPRLSSTKEIVNREYAPATLESHRGVLGTVIPSSTSYAADRTGAAFDIHPKEPLAFNAVVAGPNGKEMTVFVSARAHRILQQHNRDGKVNVSFVEAIRMAEEEERMEKSGALVQDTAATAPVTFPVEEVPAKRGRPKRTASAAAQPTSALVVTINGPAGSMVLRALAAFTGGHDDMCLVIVQDQQLGTVYLPPVSTDNPSEFTISFNGKVYKAVPALYYQLPGTTVFHTVYLVV